jgi:steroid delta-isomerase-like uncharacterized protein
MSTADNKALVERFFAALNSGNLAALDEVIGPEYVQHSVFGVPDGLDALKGLIGAMAGAFPDMRATVEAMVADGDRVVARWRMTATHQGPFQGLPATGKAVDISGMDMWRVQNGRLVEHWDALDQIGMMQQLGVMPAPGQAAA